VDADRAVEDLEGLVAVVGSKRTQAAQQYKQRG
jgi:hypothetical protein